MQHSRKIPRQGQEVHGAIASLLGTLLTAILILIPPIAWAQESPRRVDCSSISSILANPEVCDKQPVRITGKVVHFERQTSKRGSLYTKFTLTDNSKQLTFFSYDHLKLENGNCVQVEGTYYIRREVGPDTFKNQVVVEKKAKGISLVPCPEPLSIVEGIRSTPQPDRPQPNEFVWKQWKLVSLGILLLIVLAAVAVMIVKKRGKDGKVREEERYRQMGKEFEEYIIRLFPNAEWEITDRCSDTSLQIDRKIIGDVSYDFIVKHRYTSQQFIIQCKYRTRFHYEGDYEGIDWAKPYQIRNYKNFQQEKGWPYLGVIGVGGLPRQPEHLFVLLLERLRYKFMWKQSLIVGKRDTRTPFTIDEQGWIKGLDQIEYNRDKKSDK